MNKRHTTERIIGRNVPEEERMSQQDPNQADIARSLLSEASLGDATALPIEARDTAADSKAAIEDVLAAASQAETDLAELAKRRDLIPAQGYSRLQGEIKADAEKRAGEARSRMERSLAETKRHLVEASLPRLEGDSREALARDSLRTAVGDATSDSLVARAVGVATYGDHETTAVLFTPFFRTFLISRSVSNVDAVIKDLKEVAASQAPQRGGSAKEKSAHGASQQLGKYRAALTSAELALRDVVR